MHNHYFVEVDNEDKWGRTFVFGELFADYDEAVEYAKTLISDHDAVRVVDECYGRTWWEYKAYKKEA